MIISKLYFFLIFFSSLGCLENNVSIGISEIYINGVAETGEELEVYIMEYNYEASVKLIVKDKVYEYSSKIDIEESYCDTICDFDNGTFVLMVGNNKTKKFCRVWSIPDTMELVEKSEYSSKYKFKIKFNKDSGIKGDEVIEFSDDIVFDCTLTKFL